MPILEIQIVGAQHTDRELAQRLADAAGRALDSRPSGTWVRLTFLDNASYAENEAPLDAPMEPVFVSVLQRESPIGEALETQIARLTEAIADTCQRPPSNVHVLIQPDAKGRLAFGGRLVK